VFKLMTQMKIWGLSTICFMDMFWSAGNGSASQLPQFVIYSI